MPLRTVTLRAPDIFGCRRGAVAGDFTAWTPIDLPLGADGYFHLVVSLPPSGRWRYQRCLDDVTWTNDTDADDLEKMGGRGVVSVRFS